MSRRGDGDRSAEDRRRARLEREQRRARREGRPVPRSLEELDGARAPADPGAPDAPWTPPATAGPPATAPSDALPREGAPPPPTAPPATARPFDARTSRPDPSAAPAASSPSSAAPPSPDPAAGRGVAPPSTDGAPPAPRADAPRGTDAPARRRPAVAPEAGVPSPGRGRRRAADAPSRRDQRAEAREQRAAAKRERAAQQAAAKEERVAAAQRPPATRSERQEIRLAKRRAKIQRRTGTAPGPGGGPATVLGPRTAPARRGVSRLAAFLVLVPILVAIVVGVVLFQPLKGGGEGRVVVTIPPGSSVDDIGRLLHENGVVSNATFFAVRARLSGAAGDLRAGRLELRRDMSYGAAIDALQQDPLPPATVNVTVPEGLSRREAARVAREAGVRGSYLSASARSPGFDPHDYGQPRSRSGLEGFLFPATFELTRGNATARRLVDEQIGAFRRNIRGISWKRARRANLTRYDVLIIASLIEREVRVPSERRLVAAVIYNRLKEGTPLYIDATIRYAERNWTRPLRQSELRRPGPYNTRLRKGLPPTPIGSPGRAAIVAAANPARTDATYYVVRPCGKGRHNFSSSAEQFNRDAAFYESERKRLGRDPSDATNCRKR